MRTCICVQEYFRHCACGRALITVPASSRPEILVQFRHETAMYCTQYMWIAISFVIYSTFLSLRHNTWNKFIDEIGRGWLINLKVDSLRLSQKCNSNNFKNKQTNKHLPIKEVECTDCTCTQIYCTYLLHGTCLLFQIIGLQHVYTRCAYVQYITPNVCDYLMQQYSGVYSDIYSSIYSRVVSHISLRHSGASRSVCDAFIITVNCHN